MIVAEQKTLSTIKTMLDDCRKVLAVGCGTCVTVCFAGGASEVGILASTLRMARRVDGKPLDVAETTVQRQCEDEYLEPLGEGLDQYDAILSLGCGIGVQSLADRYPDKRVLPALNTTFMGRPTEQGIWEERCQACGNCVLDRTGGICPVTRCAKSLFNGPCGGVQDGKCEVDPTLPCAWELIWKRMGKLGLIDRLLEIEPAKDWSTSRDGGPRRIARDDLRLPDGDGA
ncbi:MAG: methylenetetrahydrofolate reductase C-terminal domain-containing protein [Alphaproteobacteria bacterium]|jgi:ferredoxin|nr:methylenetetrahydrofolate reductase C-terminal domain-containing protein [Alphaproteobacteria bacterium]MDP6602657.1 methylenetetrahydrofolate reductase C-terminal domain-containing protein [Rhodospirillales bacterium]